MGRSARARNSLHGELRPGGLETHCIELASPQRGHDVCPLGERRYHWITVIRPRPSVATTFARLASGATTGSPQPGPAPAWPRRLPAWRAALPLDHRNPASPQRGHDVCPLGEPRYHWITATRPRPSVATTFARLASRATTGSPQPGPAPAWPRRLPAWRAALPPDHRNPASPRAATTFARPASPATTGSPQTRPRPGRPRRPRARPAPPPPDHPNPALPQRDHKGRIPDCDQSGFDATRWYCPRLGAWPGTTVSLWIVLGCALTGSTSGRRVMGSR